MNMQRQDAGLADLLRRQGGGAGGVELLPASTRFDWYLCRLDAEVKRLEEGLQAQAQTDSSSGVTILLPVGSAWPRGNHRSGFHPPWAQPTQRASAGILFLLAEAQTRLRLAGSTGAVEIC